MRSISPQLPTMHTMQVNRYFMLLSLDILRSHYTTYVLLVHLAEMSMWLVCQPMHPTFDLAIFYLNMNALRPFGVMASDRSMAFGPQSLEWCLNQPTYERSPTWSFVQQLLQWSQWISWYHQIWLTIFLTHMCITKWEHRYTCITMDEVSQG